MLIQKTNAHAETAGIKAVVFGQSGTGKTRSIISLKKAGFKVLLISAESGTISLADEVIDMIDISRDDNGVEIPMEKRFERIGEIFKFLKNGKHDYDTVCLDSMTEINKCLIAYLKAKPEYQDPKNTLKMYGENLETMTKLARVFRDLPYNVVLISLSGIEKDDVGRRFVTTDLVGQVANHIPPLFDEVLYLHIADADGKPERRFQCHSTKDVICKDRSGKLSLFEPYDLGAIFTKIKTKKETK